MGSPPKPWQQKLASPAEAGGHEAPPAFFPCPSMHHSAASASCPDLSRNSPDPRTCPFPRTPAEASPTYGEFSGVHTDSSFVGDGRLYGTTGGMYSGGSLQSVPFYGGSPYYGSLNYGGAAPSYTGSSMLEGLSRVSSVLHAQGFYLDQLGYHAQLLQQRVTSLVACLHSLQCAAFSSAAFLQRRAVALGWKAASLTRKGCGVAQQTAASFFSVLQREQRRLLSAIAEEWAAEDDCMSTLSLVGDLDAEFPEKIRRDEEAIRRLLPRLVKRIRCLMALLVFLVAFFVLSRKRKVRCS